ncbi:hypothetical protein DEU56DRAFT_741013 [Suillus clintonianus]|uniref:uncharacterized protein n=1 Tax=Suillus clintonianus TaxID=1904413 RepID=UPI001B874273|nr:uncharacterized protein DEU56DRAFT_741013 [Suillus clintonianus]KAG2129917.1 hypothetical protein DEU56DRAFT_741013 [Suillus clintonianus]
MLDEPHDQCSDAPVVIVDDRQDNIVPVDPSPQDLTVTAIVKVVDATPKTTTSTAPVIQPPMDTASPPSNLQEPSDDASIHSLPVVAAQTPSVQMPTAISTEQSPEPSNRLIERSTSIRNNRRSVMDTRPSNRLSGFWSNLIHRRDTITPSSSRTSARDDRPQSADPVQSDSNSRSPSPTPARPLTPPPSLAPPTLRELGLSLSVVTEDLSPSHFTTPPTSGTFMAPHYLLLCHAQGLDVLPLISPPAAHPYALVRRVSFKSVVVMEHRGVLVAIAGRRDGVRVYALEEVKKAVEWRMEVETRRERERSRREESKKGGSGNSSVDQRDPTEAKFKSLSRAAQVPKAEKVLRKSSFTTTVTQKLPRPPTLQPVTPRQPVDQPPPYSTITETTRPRLQAQASTISINLSRSRRSSLSHVVVPPIPSLPNVGSGTEQENPMTKSADWLEASDDEAIDMLTAGASGSQALDERTSAIPPPRNSDTVENGSTSLPVRSQATYSSRRNRPANLDLTLAQPNTILAQPPEPSPTLLTIRQALQSSPPNIRTTPPTPASTDEPSQRRSVPDIDLDDDDDDGATGTIDRITLVQALLESRVPDLPPAGTTRPQAPIMIGATPSVTDDEVPLSPSLQDGRSSLGRPSIASRPERRRRRWSVFAGIFNGSGSADAPRPNVPVMYDTPLGSPTSLTYPTMPIPEADERPLTLTRSASTRSRPTEPLQLAPRPSTSGGHSVSPSVNRPPLPTAPPYPTTPSHSRLIPRIISNAFSSRRSDERPPALVLTEPERRNGSQTPTTPLPPPKLDYVKLPGTKGSLIIKAVETPKKSFLAILCGENGEKVELFAGTYRTALGLSRTFILPDSPRSLELQLQGDDLVEVFLVFSQNVFGLEPATVRVREVRIGRAERRAARRRVREIRSGQPDVLDTDPPAQDDEDTNISIGGRLSLPSGEDPSRNNSNTNLPDAPLSQSHTPTGSAPGSALAHAEELVALASAPLGPYTTFQQLSYAPKLPLATIADDYIIPPTYPEFLDYRAEHEPDAQGTANVDLASIQFSPPGLPMPAPAPPSRWFYRDPKGVVHGPWKASLMQAWYKDGLLPPDLPVRKEDDKEFMLLKDLRQQCVDPSHPFRSATPLSAAQHAPPALDAAKPLLAPISLLVQPRHFGPPALFFSSRGGHSTSIVDARGRAVLKGRFIWSTDNADESKMISRMGDVKRVEAFDVKDRSVLVAMRQGGVEAMDFGDALLKPADESRTLLPQFAPPPSNINRRGPFVWKIGTPIGTSTSGAAALSSKTKGSGYLGKKPSYTTGKSPARAEFNGTGDGDTESTDEVLFLGRQGDEVYLCERNTGAFRILRLCPDLS